MWRGGGVRKQVRGSRSLQTPVPLRVKQELRIVCWLLPPPLPSRHHHQRQSVFGLGRHVTLFTPDIIVCQCARPRPGCEASLVPHLVYYYDYALLRCTARRVRAAASRSMGPVALYVPDRTHVGKVYRIPTTFRIRLLS